MKSFFIRLASSTVILAVYIASYVLRNTVWLPVILALTCACAVYETFKATGFEERLFLYPFALVFAAATPFVHNPLILAAAFVLVLFVLVVANFGKGDITHTVFLGFMAIFISIALSSLVRLREFDKFEYTLPLIFGASVCDVFCYLCGMLLGRHKLCPNLSPKKTVEGSVGGTLFTVGAFLIYAHFTGLSLTAMAVLGLAVGVLSQLGDLAASAIKRTFGIKDFSNLIPGHGGIMDRVDSWLFAAPAIYIAVYILSAIGKL